MRCGFYATLWIGSRSAVISVIRLGRFEALVWLVTCGGGIRKVVVCDVLSLSISATVVAPSLLSYSSGIYWVVLCNRYFGFLLTTMSQS